MIKLILFDLDGVLVDAVELHKRAFIQAVKEKGGYEVSDIFHDINLNGLPTKKKLSLLVSRNEINETDVETIEIEKQRLTQSLIEDQIKKDEKKRLLLNTLLQDGYRVGCVTNSTARNAGSLLTAANLYHSLEIVISNQDVKFPKPHPEGYWQGMSHFGFIPEETLIVEDSDKGIQAAEATGAHIWRVKGPSEVTWRNIAHVLRQMEE